MIYIIQMEGGLCLAKHEFRSLKNEIETVVQFQKDIRPLNGISTLASASLRVLVSGSLLVAPCIHFSSISCRHVTSDAGILKHILSIPEICLSEKPSLVASGFHL